MVLSILASFFLTAAAEARTSATDMCRFVNSNSSRDAPEVGYVFAAAGAAAGALTGQIMTKPPAYTVPQLLEWLQTDQGAMDGLLSSIREMQSSGKELSDAYEDYYKYYSNDRLKQPVQDRILPTQRLFLHSLKDFLRTVENQAADLPNYKTAPEEIVKILRAQRSRTISSMLHELRSAILSIPSRHMSETDAHEAVATRLEAFKEDMDKLEREFADTFACSAVLNPKIKYNETRNQQLIFAGAGGVAGAAAGWTFQEVVRLAGGIVLASICDHKEPPKPSKPAPAISPKPVPKQIQKPAPAVVPRATPPPLARPVPPLPSPAEKPKPHELDQPN